jgi:hypothetical protein
LLFLKYFVRLGTVVAQEQEPHQFLSVARAAYKIADGDNREHLGVLLWRTPCAQAPQLSRDGQIQRYLNSLFRGQRPGMEFYIKVRPPVRTYSGHGVQQYIHKEGDRWGAL